MTANLAPANDAWGADAYAANARFVSNYGHALVDLLAPKRGERIPDLGCGDGALMKTLIDASAEVVGVDASPSMIEGARKLGLDARVMDGAELTFDAEFDAVFSDGVLHWMLRPREIVASVYRVCR